MDKEGMDALEQRCVGAWHDLIITTPCVPGCLARHRDGSLSMKHEPLRNAGTRQSRAVRKLRAALRIALTGTPIENSLGDLLGLV